MTKSGRAATSAVARCAVLALVGLALGGCASKSYVVLLGDPDGKVGRVHVTTPAGTTHLQRAGEGTVIGGAVGTTFAVGDEQINKDFGAALEASPLLPASFLLYFRFGAAELTDPARATLPQILDEIRRRPAPEVSVIGHTDTVGDAMRNETLGRERAALVARIIRAAGMTASAVRLVTESHGERNLLVATPDDTDEPRNRRVEVTVR